MVLPLDLPNELSVEVASGSLKGTPSYSIAMMLKSIVTSMDRQQAVLSDMVEMLEVLLQEHSEDSPREMI